MNGQQLKNSILQWAIQGKLVPQDPNEGTAEDLLKDIRAEKERLVKEGQLKKKDFVFSDIYKDEDGKWWENDGKKTQEVTDEIPFEIPKNWKWCRLKQLVSLITKGSSPSWQGVKYVDNGILFITSENVREGYLDLSTPKYLEEKFNSLQSRSILKKGDLLTNIVGASIGRTALFELDDDNCNINQAVAIIRLLSKDCNPYFLKVLNSPFVIIQMFGKTVETARPNISLGSVENLYIPLPPLAEQKRIVAKIEELMPLVEQYGKSQEKLNKLNEAIYGQLEKSILQEAIQGKLVPQLAEEGSADSLLADIRAEKERLVKEGKLKKKDLVFSDIYQDEDGKWWENTEEENKELKEDILPFLVPINWKWVRLNEICTFLSRGKSPKYSESKKYPVFAQKCNLKEGGISLDMAQFLDPNTLDKWPETFHLKTGDVLINSTGTGTVGRTRLFHESCLGTYPFVVPDSHVTVVRSSKNVESAYLYYLLNSKIFQDYIEDNLAGSTNQKELYIGVVQAIPIPLPPLAEQQRIVSEIERWFGVIDALERNEGDLLKSIEQTKKKVLDLAIHGKLVPQNPNDEPASVALKKINPQANIISENDEFGDVPNGWCLVSIDDLNEYKAKTLKPLDYEVDKFELYSVPIYATGKPEFVRGKDIGSTKQTVQKNDVLLCKINPHLNRVWIVEHFIEDLKCLASSEWVVIRSSIASSLYLRNCLMSDYFRLLLNSNVSGVGGSLTRAQPMYIKKYLIPLPPLAEQQRIVAKIEQIFGELDKIKELSNV